jgi:FtsP/CotA-like multicopper oxidase with cupredoxin domain
MLAGCGMMEGPGVPDVLTPPPSGRDAEMTPARDINPDPTVLEIVLEAKPSEVEYLPGRTTPAWAYGGTVPGPLIEARMGDRLVVHFRNSLPEATTIHWHGLRVPADMDGVEPMMAPVPPGGTFDYAFTLKDAGTYWYHPHIRSDRQVEKGLYGALIVRGPDDPAVGAERILMLDDVWLDEQGQPVSDSPSTTQFGRQGNLLLVNGRANPTLTIRPGERQRWRLANAANARYFRVALPGAKLVLIGSEAGLLETPRPVSEVLLSPGERVDLAIEAPSSADSVLRLMAMRYNRGHHLVDSRDLPLLALEVAGEPTTARPIPVRFRDIEALSSASGTVRRTLALEEPHGGHGPGHGGRGGPGLFSINGESFPRVTPFLAKLGAVELWDVENTTMMDHPFHLHGFRFQILQRDGVLEPFRAWKDTVNVRPGEAVRLAVPLDGFPGRWLYHCHILEHAEAGMMGELDVSP